ncbi:MAG: exo-alpha-sialidase [Myxococcales bacterium]|nr:exo-alpha-sialidase [Myxococcales bacterium]
MRTRTALSSLVTLTLSVALACSGSLSSSDRGDAGDQELDPPGARDASVTADGEASPLDADVASPDASPESDAAAPPPDAGGAPDGRVPVFVAQGHAGRLVRSCDGGRSWIDDQSHDDAIRCFSGGFDCDHHPGAGKGITYGRERFYATFGWGPAGGVFRSEHGARWSPLLEGTTFGGIAFGRDTVLLGARDARRSADRGDSWSSPISTSLQGWNVRRVGWVDAGEPGDEGRFVVIGDGDGGPDMVVSGDGGRSWWRPTFPRGTCGNGVQSDGGVAFGNGVLVVVGSDGNVCRSTDAGRTFTAARVGAGIGSQLVFDGTRFFVWAQGRAFHSPDGATWTEQATTPSVAPGPVAYHPTLRRFVAVRGGWQTWYDQQVFWHSEDGVRWSVAEARGGHPIRFVAAGFAPPSERCPLP